MSVSVSDLMKLPCLREAEVVAGHRGLNRVIASISVLEYAEVSVLQDDLFGSIEFLGDELVISGFINIKDDVDAQCANIQRLAEAGEAGLILYYVGIFLPKIDARLVALANQLDFVLICMPKKRMNLRYSEVICEVMDAIFKDRNENQYFINEVLERVSRLPSQQRNIETIIKMLSDRMQASFILTDRNLKYCNTAAWPRTLEFHDDLLISYVEQLPSDGAPIQVVGSDIPQFLQRVPLSADIGYNMHLFVIRDIQALTKDEVRQTSELLRIAVNLWSKQHTEPIMSELVRSILNDEPMNMRRLASFFHIDIASINSMWIISPTDVASSTQTLQLEKILTLSKNLLSSRSKTLIADIYDNNVVVFMDNSSITQSTALDAQELKLQLNSNEIGSLITLCFNLSTTADVRKAYLSTCDYKTIASTIFPARAYLSLQEIRFAERCRNIIDDGELSINEALAPLDVLKNLEANSQFEIVNTLQSFLIDCDCNIAKTAEIMFLHKNTIKYRIQKISEYLCHPITKMPEVNELYLACAIKRGIDNT